MHNVTVRRSTLAERLAVLALLATLALLPVDVLAPDHLWAALLAYLLLLAALAIWLLVHLIATTYPPATANAFQVALRRPPARPLQPEPLLQLGRQLTYAQTSSVDLHYRLRPLLRTIAAQRLANRRNISLDDQPERARALLHPAAWELLRPDRPPPADRHARGLTLATLAQIVATLEEI
jgi:hypothetical protein